MSIPSPPPDHHQPDDPLPSPTTFPPTSSSPTTPPRKDLQWLTWALGSGAFAAFNGVFAKLTTTSQTNTLSSAISTLLGLSAHNTIISFLIRAMFFAMNLICNAIMWILFTRALTLASSTTRVAVLNTSANFVVTAVLGMLVFSEGLPLLWWVGACFLVAGSVTIGLREEKEKESGQDGGLLGEDDGEDAGQAASVVMGTGGAGAGTAVVDSVQGSYRDRDSLEDEQPEAELDNEGYKDKQGRTRTR